MKSFAKKITLYLLTVSTIVSFGLFMLVPTASAAIALVQTASGNGGGYVNSYTVAFGSNVVAGDTLILALAGGSGDRIASLTDNKNGAWTFIASTSNATGGRASQLFYVPSTVAGATTITITYNSGQSNDSAMIIREYSGLTNPSLDVVATGTDSTSFLQSHSVGPSSVTTQANELVFATLGTASSTEGYTAGSGYGNLSSQRGFDAFTSGAVEDKTVSATGAQTATMTTVGFDAAQMVLATFKSAAAGSHAKATITGAKVTIPKGVVLIN